MWVHLDMAGAVAALLFVVPPSRENSAARTMEPEETRAMYQDFCKVGKMLTAEEDVECARLVECLKAVLKQKVTIVLDKCKHRPVLFSYGSDATSYLCQSVSTANASGTHTQFGGAKR